MEGESNICPVSDAATSSRPNEGCGAESRGHSPPRRHLAAIAGSLAAHAIIFAAIIFVASRAQPRGHHWVLAYVIDLGVASGGGAHGGGAAAARLAPEPASPPKEALPIPRARAHRAPRSHRAIASAIVPAAPIEADSTDRAEQKRASGDSSGTATAPVARVNDSGHSNHAGSGGGSGGQGGGADAASGDGHGAGGASIAHADYGSDPAPLYPARSRRRGEQGTVMLHVLIAADGAVERVDLLLSSGFRALDDAAVQTVRERWRFVPARRDGVAIESWATLPIRFALTEASN